MTPDFMKVELVSGATVTSIFMMVMEAMEIAAMIEKILLFPIEPFMFSAGDYTIIKSTLISEGGILETY